MSRWMLAGGLVVIVACGGGDNGTGPVDGGGETLVHAKRVTATTAFTFDPNAVSIPAQDSIFFTFQSVRHNVVFDTPGNPGNIPNTVNATVKLQFTTVGTFNYHCSIHPSMTGAVTVTALP